MSHPVLDRLTKQAKELDAKGAMKTKHEELTLQNLQTKIDAIKKAAKS